MTDNDFPHTGYGVVAFTYETGWVLIDGIHRTHADATKTMQSITGKHGFTADDLRVAALTITRKGDTE